MNVALIGNATLRTAIQHNLVSFPSQIPAFTKSGDEQKRIVHLYFISGWEISEISHRYRIGKWTIRTILSEWKIRAVAAGYIQEIHPEILDSLASEEDPEQGESLEPSAPVSTPGVEQARFSEWHTLPPAICHLPSRGSGVR